MQFTGLVVDLLLQTIPQKFVQRLTGKITGTIKLESRAGSSFDVQVINNQGKVSLGFGWEAFVSAHDLNMGDFLVFKYDQRSHFKVLIFDSSGCEKVRAIHSEIPIHVCVMTKSNIYGRSRCMVS